MKIARVLWLLAPASAWAAAADIPPAIAPPPVPPMVDPRALVLDKAGNIYIADMTNVLIYKMSPQGRLEVLAGKYQVSGAGDGPGKDALFRYPLGVALDKDGNVFVADAGNGLVRKISPAGTVTTFGPAMGIFSRVAGVDFPTGIAMDAVGNIFVADAENEAVRKITPDGVVTTVGGTTAK